MSYVHRQIKGADVIELEESVDLYSAPMIKKFAKSLLHDPKRRIVISLERVVFMDSSGLGFLVNLFHECKQKGIPIKLANLSVEVKKILAISKMTEDYEIHETLEDAFKSF